MATPSTTPPNSPRSTAQPSDSGSELKWSFVATPQETREAHPYKCKDEFTKGFGYFALHSLCLVAFNGGLAYGVNYLKGKPVIPLTSAALSALSQSVIHHTLIDGRSWAQGWNIRRVDMFSLEKLQAVITGVILTPFITYYGSKTLCHQQIRVLPTIGMSVLGAVALTCLEMSH
ncbi:MAG: hypothetical protein H7A38_06725 [Chlamydiales bacterium]|nr:hypothetical protein [Chlamydiales bacterium]